MGSEQTIAALATPQGTGALAVVRVSGGGAFAVVGSCMAERGRFVDARPRTVGLYRFVNHASREVIDEVVAVKYKGGRSFTGEDMVEVTCHGGKGVVSEVVVALVQAGARYAKNGEFSMRAFLNGKLTLAKAEAMQRLIEARSHTVRSTAVKGYLGEYGRALGEIKARLEEALAELEARIEFPEEESAQEARGPREIARELREQGEWLRRELRKRESLVALDRGVEVAIVGAPNAGKSTLFNRILLSERSITHGLEGTTRDFVREDIDIEGRGFTVVDTAGIRQCRDEVERAAVERAMGYLRNAGYVIWVTPADREVTADELSILEERGSLPLVAVVSKVDVASSSAKEAHCRERGIEVLPLCLLSDACREPLVAFLAGNVVCGVDAAAEGCIIQSDRQEAAIRKAVREIEAVEDDGGEEIVAERVRGIIGCIEEFVGECATEEVLEKVFSSFCVGK